MSVLGSRFCPDVLSDPPSWCPFTCFRLVSVLRLFCRISPSQSRPRPRSPSRPTTTGVPGTTTPSGEVGFHPGFSIFPTIVDLSVKVFSGRLSTHLPRVPILHLLPFRPLLRRQCQPVFPSSDFFRSPSALPSLNPYSPNPPHRPPWRLVVVSYLPSYHATSSSTPNQSSSLVDSICFPVRNRPSDCKDGSGVGSLVGYQCLGGVFENCTSKSLP